MSRHQQTQRTWLALTCLEDRIVPANLIWTGDVDDRWGTSVAGNTNWALDMLPHNGDSLIFPASSQNHTNTNNLTGLVVNNLTVQFHPFTISGNAITLTGNFLDSTGSNATNGILNNPLRLSPGSHTISISASPNGNHDEFNGGIGESGGGPATLIKDGAGDLHFTGTGNTYTGLTTLSDGFILLATNSGVALPGDLQIAAGFGNHVEYSTVGPGNQIADSAAVTINSQGHLDLFGQSDIVGPMTVMAGGTLNTADFTNQFCHLTTGNLSLASDSNLLMRIQSPPSFDRITVNGTVQLGGTLLLNNGPAGTAVGSALTLIENDGSDPVTGTFAGLPQGAVFPVNNSLFSIDYAGGTGNDVVVTRLPNLMVTGTRVNDGAAQRSRVTSLTVTFNALATFASTPEAAFTLVRNSDNASVPFTATASVVGGVTVVTLDNYGGGNATQFGSLADGRYTLTAIASQLSFAGQPLDGNGDGFAGDNYTFGDAQGLFRFFGDVNGDQTINGFDLGFFRNALGTQTGDPKFLSYLDFNGDGVINGFDFGQLRTRFGTMLP